MLAKAVLFACLVAVGAVHEERRPVYILKEVEPPPRPYAFGYAAGRYSGHIDRTHSEVSDGSGVVKGTFSYVDPAQKIRTVDYVADKHGFHPILSHPEPSDTAAVAAAKARHAHLYAKIANEHQSAPVLRVVPQDSRAVEAAKHRHLDLYQRIAAEHARIAAERKLLNPYEEHDENHYQIRV